jgi:hypothetical protein
VNPLTLGLVIGGVFGLLSVASMLPMKFPDKAAAVSAAFVNRFAIGFIASTLDLPVPQWVTGLVVGLVLSLPEVLTTKKILPILILGIVGGAVCGLVAGHLVAPELAGAGS